MTNDEGMTKWWGVTAGRAGDYGTFRDSRTSQRVLGPAPELLSQTAKPGLEIAVHQLDELALVLGRDFKPRGPFNVRAVAISNWQHSERRAMIANGNGRADESVGIAALGIGERDENFTKHLTISLCQNADAPDACRISTVLDGARFHEWQPVSNCVEAADHRPNLLRRPVHNTADKHLRHSLWAVTAKPQSATRFRVSPE